MVINWQTSLIGVVLIALGIIGIHWTCVDSVTGLAIIMAGVGFLRAKDKDVTGGTVMQPTPPEILNKQQVERKTQGETV